MNISTLIHFFSNLLKKQKQKRHQTIRQDLDNFGRCGHQFSTKNCFEVRCSMFFCLAYDLSMILQPLFCKIIKSIQRKCKLKMQVIDCQLQTQNKPAQTLFLCSIDQKLLITFHFCFMTNGSSSWNFTPATFPLSF